MKIKKHITTFIIMSLFFSACSSQGPEKNTIGSIDIINKRVDTKKVFIKPRSTADIRKAYAEYLKHASLEDKSRLDAINRLAEIEFELSSQLQQEQENKNGETKEEKAERLYNARLQKTIELLVTSLKDYPNAKGNDKILYQLAKAYDHSGDNINAEKTLTRLVKKYPKSPYYIESQFRLAENYFSRRKYPLAEDTYTDIITHPKNNVFYEKALFKRGWARFKQEFYLEAVDDYLRAIDYHQFDDINTLGASEKDQFNEYFRAVGLAFSYLGGAQPLNEYFKENPEFPYIYYSYEQVSNIYRKQQRFSDAVETLRYYIKNNPDSKDVPMAYVRIVNTWKEGGFANKAIAEIETLYNKFNPQNKYWLSRKSGAKAFKAVNEALKKDILLAASFYHKRYTEKPKKQDFTNADKWYKRYLKHYRSYARKDKVYYQYASLISAKRQYAKAFKLYEKAAYDGDIILDKNAAYATILLSDKLHKINKGKPVAEDYLNKHIRYATLYTQLYANSKRAGKIILHAAELAFKTQQYKKAIELAETVTEKKKGNSSTRARIIKAHSYFKLGQYDNAEAAYYAVMADGKISSKLRSQLNDKLALSVYKQAENASKAGKLQEAIENYTRIARLAPGSSIAETGYVDAVALAMQNKLWDVSIQHIKNFQKRYPRSRYSKEMTKKLSVAYLNSNQGIKAAQEFEKISGFEKNKDVQIAALWQAAELYEEKGNTDAAIRSYEKYVKKYKKPYPQYMEALKKLTELYTKAGNKRKVMRWNKEIVKADKRTIKKDKTQRTRYITSSALLALGRNAQQRFNKQRLVLPLNRSLRRKKTAMKEAVKYFGLASKFAIAETATEATDAIAQIYQRFSKDLLESEKPKGLKGDELEQYTILLEDKAFPFEDKAIEFYEANMSHIKDGVYDKWVQHSHNQLKELFPVRYKRSAKLDGVINEIH